MSQVKFEDLLEAGVHFGHLKRKWNPAMAPYIFMERNGIHIIDLHKTAVKLEEAAEAMKQIVKSGRRVLFVATKKQAKDIVAEKVSKVGMPYVTERWAGGMLTNFPTIRKAVKKMTNIDKMKDYQRKCYKATLSKMKFEAGKHHQWSVANAPEDAPITFQEITIQEWEEGTGFTNTDGVGTEDW